MDFDFEPEKKTPSGAGKPPAKEITSGIVVNLSNSRISEAFKPIARSENFITNHSLMIKCPLFPYVIIISLI